MSRIGTKLRAGEARFREIVTVMEQTRHQFAGTVSGVGGGTTPHPYRVGAETAPAGFGMAERTRR
jgi:hypothetical protein